MDTAQPCPVCTPRREANSQPARVPNRPQVCDACRSITASRLAEIPGLLADAADPGIPAPRSWRRPTSAAEQANQHHFKPARRTISPGLHLSGALRAAPHVPDDAADLFASALPEAGRGVTVETDRCECGLPREAHRRTGDTITVHPDPVYRAVPAGPTRAVRPDASVSGSREAPIPMDVDIADLTGHYRTRVSGTAVGLSPAGRRHLDDQIGHLPVVATLDWWVTDLIDHRGVGEHRPVPTVAALCSWLGDRLDDACDTHPAIAEMADAISGVWSTLRGVARLLDVPEYVDGVACPDCATYDLWRVNGSELVECGSCPRLMTPAEYAHWVHGEAAGAAAYLSWMLALSGLCRRRGVGAVCALLAALGATRRA